MKPAWARKQGMVAVFSSPLWFPLNQSSSGSWSHLLLEAAGHLSAECVSLLVVGFPFGFLSEPESGNGCSSVPFGHHPYPPLVTLCSLSCGMCLSIDRAGLGLGSSDFERS
jgi:hypothetical protein